MDEKIITLRVFVNHETLAAFITSSDDNCQMKIGRHLKDAREQAEITQTALQKLCGWGPGNSRIANYESDSREPSLGDIEIIGRHLGFTVGQLIAKAEGRSVTETAAPAYGLPPALKRLFEVSQRAWGRIPEAYFDAVSSAFEALLGDSSHIQGRR